MDPLYDPIAVQEENYLNVILRSQQDKDSETNKLDTTLRELALRPAIAVGRDASIRDVIRMMKVKGIGSALVTEEDKVVGIFTERDILNKVILESLELESTPVTEVMTAKPETLGLYDSISFAINLMSDSGYRHVPVTDSSARALHVASVRDLAAFLADCYPECVMNLPPTAGRYAEARDGG